MDDFSSPDATNTYNLPPGPNNFPEPGKRPLSSMDPLILMDSNGDLSLAIGASGGPRILSGTIETLLRVHFLNDDLKQATDAPRLHHQYLPNILYYEPNFSKVSAFNKLFHTLAALIVIIKFSNKQIK